MIDAHVHVWSLDAERYPWQQTLSHVPVPTTPAPAEDLLQKMEGAGVEHAVLVQPSVYGWDNSYLCHCLERYPDVFTGVCLVDPKSTGAADDLRYWCEIRGCRGVRINIIGESDAGWILGASQSALMDAASALKVPVCFQMRPSQSTLIAEIGRRHPGMRLVADYLGPDAYFDRTSLESLAELEGIPNVYVKILSAAQDSHEPYPFPDLWPFYSQIVELFGAQRTLFGTDYPHVQIGCSYTKAIEWLAALPFLDDTQREHVGRGTARSLWSIHIPDGSTT